MSERRSASAYLRMAAAPAAGAAALLAAVLALGIDPFVAAIIGALTWAGAHLMISARGGLSGPPSVFTPAQTEHLQRARSHILRLRDLAPSAPEPEIVRTLDEIADQAEALLASALRAPDTYSDIRRPLGTFLEQAVAIAERLNRAERAEKGAATGRALAGRARDSLERLRALFAACRERAGRRDHLELDARIAVLEAEITAENAWRS